MTLFQSLIGILEFFNCTGMDAELVAEKFQSLIGILEFFNPVAQTLNSGDNRFNP